MTTALASLFSGRRARPLIAMTGEVTLSGRVLPIGGVKEKALGARRAGIKTVIVPERNRKDVMEDLPAEIRSELNFVFVTDVKDVLDLALEPRKEETEADSTPNSGKDEGSKFQRKQRTTSISEVIPGTTLMH